MDELVQEAIQAKASLAGSRKRIQGTLSAPCPCGVKPGAFCFPAARGFHHERWFTAASQAFGGVR